ncbi:MAG TPA: TadE/TadG family type IV pilus assembly protein [Acidimicrobiia bacterium]
MSSERGSAVVEFAIVLPLVLLLVLAMVEVAVVARAQLEVMNAAREGAREAATSPDPARAVAAAKAALGRGGSVARVSVSRPHVVGEQAAVTVRLTHRVASPLLGGFVIELTGRAAMRVEA